MATSAEKAQIYGVHDMCASVAMEASSEEAVSVKENCTMFHIKDQGRVDVIYLCIMMLTSKKQHMECSSIGLVKATNLRFVEVNSTSLEFSVQVTSVEEFSSRIFDMPTEMGRIIIY